MDTRAVAIELGVASAIKMCRSIMIKGMEALVIESYATARHYGVESYVLPTLEETFPQIDWERTGAYFFSRVAQHGKRRAEEMRESARTVQEAGFAPIMATAIAEKHDWVAAQARAGTFRDMPTDAPWQAVGGSAHRPQALTAKARHRGPQPERQRNGRDGTATHHVTALRHRPFLTPVSSLPDDARGPRFAAHGVSPRSMSALRAPSTSGVFMNAPRRSAAQPVSRMGRALLASTIVGAMAVVPALAIAQESFKVGIVSFLSGQAAKASASRPSTAANG